MYDMGAQKPMNYSDLFMAQNLGLNPPPMSGAASPWAGMMAGGQPPMSASQPVQMPPEINHLNDIIQQYTQNKQDQSNNSGLVQQILSNRMQPSDQDTSTSIFKNAISAPSQYTSPDQVMADRFKDQLAPYTQGMALANQSAELTGRNIQNNIQEQTGLPTAMAEMQIKQIAAQIQQQTGLPMAQAELQARQIAAQYAPQQQQADIAQKNAMAGYYGGALQRELTEKAFDYANNPANLQARMMANYMASLGGSGQPMQGGPPIQGMPAPNGGMLPSTPIPQQGVSQQPVVPQQPVAPTQTAPQAAPVQQGNVGFNPMGALLAKQLGLTDMQIGPNGQPMPIPGAMKIEGGSVITIGPDGKPQSAIPVNPRAQGLFEDKLKDINDKLDRLHAINGTVEDTGGMGQFFDNKLTQIAASKGTQYTPGGQDLLQGTEAQTLRDDIQADVKQALPLYMQAFGITPGMERAQSAQQMLLDAIGGAVGKSRQHLKSNLSNLSQTAGTGELAKNLSRVTVISPNGQTGTIDPSELQSAVANGWRQAQ